MSYEMLLESHVDGIRSGGTKVQAFEYGRLMNEGR